ncbi:hypothetical protein [Bacillus mycoides]
MSPKKNLNFFAYIFTKADIIISEEGTHLKKQPPIDEYNNIVKSS